MIIDHNSKNQLTIINTALFCIRMIIASASKQNYIILARKCGNNQIMFAIPKFLFLSLVTSYDHTLTSIRIIL